MELNLNVTPFESIRDLDSSYEDEIWSEGDSDTSLNGQLSLLRNDFLQQPNGKMIVDSKLDHALKSLSPKTNKNGQIRDFEIDD